MTASVELRAISEDELADFNVAESAGFGTVPDADERQAILDADRSVFEFDRTIAAFATGPSDRRRIVGTTTAFSFGMTVPGGETVPVAGVSAVTVATTHRRQGILRRMMEHQLDDVARRHEPIAVLNASEASIYGRFGYGLAQLYQSWEIDARRAAFDRPAPDDLSLTMIPRDEAAPALEPIYDAWRATRPGALSQNEAWWGCVLSSHESWRGGGPLLVVVCEPEAGADLRDADGHLTRVGYATYTIDNDAMPGHWRLVVRELVATDAEVQARLWRYLLDVDLVDTVVAHAVPMDDSLRWRLEDPRQVRTTQVRDHLFVRILDVEAALAARRYPIDSELVLDVSDGFRPGTAGRYRVNGGPDGAKCERTDGPADLALDITDLGCLYLGGIPARDLVRAGRITELRPGKVEEATAFFGWPAAPFCYTRF